MLLQFPSHTSSYSRPANTEYTVSRTWLITDAQIILFNLISRQYVCKQNKTSLFRIFRFLFPLHCVFCLATWKEGSRLFPSGAVTSLFVVPGERRLSACSSTEIDPSSDSEGNHLVCFMSIHSHPTMLLCACSRGPPLLSLESTGHIISAFRR